MLIKVFANQPQEPTPYRGFKIMPLVREYGCDVMILDKTDFIVEHLVLVAGSVPVTIKRMKSYLDSERVRRKLRRRGKCLVPAL